MRCGPCSMRGMHRWCSTTWCMATGGLWRRCSRFPWWWARWGIGPCSISCSAASIRLPMVHRFRRCCTSPLMPMSAKVWRIQPSITATMWAIRSHCWKRSRLRESGAEQRHCRWCFPAPAPPMAFLMRIKSPSLKPARSVRSIPTAAASGWWNR